MTTDAILFPFETDLPTPAAALDELYNAFSAYSWTGGAICRQCFDEDYERAIQQITDPRSASFDVIRGLYYEHPNCAGPGRALYFLPRVIELGYWDDYELDSKMLWMDVWSWPEREQAALRQTLMIATLGWFTNGDPAPLQGPPPRPRCGKNCSERMLIGEDLLRGLFLLRVDPFSVFPWLARVGTVRAATTIAETLPDGARIADDEWMFPKCEAGQAMRSAAKALNERIAMAACDAVPPEMFSDLFFKYADSHPSTGALLSEALEFDASSRVERDDAALSAGLDVMRAGFFAAASRN